MIGLLDPALFLPRNEAEVQSEFDSVLLTCRQHSILLPEIDEYWNFLWSSLARPLESVLSSGAKRALQEVRKLGTRSKLNLPQLNQPAGQVWRRGFSQLFAPPFLPAEWDEKMAAALIRAASTENEVVLLTRRVLGRNVLRHSAAGCVLDENTRWLLHLQPSGMMTRHVRCVYHPRNLDEPWTTRFDWRLPSIAQGARYPFCPPDAWWRGGTVAQRTIQSKPAWIDKHGNGWARPNIAGGAGYHWDVFIETTALQQTVGLNQINVVEFGAPNKEGKPGQIHHIPDDKTGRITKQGWQC